LALPSVTPEERAYVTPLLLPPGVMVTNLAYLIYGFGIELFAVLSSRMHTAWVRAVSGRLGAGVRYTPTISYHTFPAPTLTPKNRDDLARCAGDILLAREAHFPATLAELYDANSMPADLRDAHERNDEVLERIYIGRRFRNDTERLEKLFELYTKLTAGAAKNGAAKKKKAGASP
ncbi:MAG: type IIL restriction-modification enzyme MmeI, partial [Terricaulis sp.]